MAAHPLLTPELLRPPLVWLIALVSLLLCFGIQCSIVILVNIPLVVLELMSPLAKVLRSGWPAVHQMEIAVLHFQPTAMGRSL
jgi:hypothetical protein